MVLGAIGHELLHARVVGWLCHATVDDHCNVADYPNRICPKCNCTINLRPYPTGPVPLHPIGSFRRGAWLARQVHALYLASEIDCCAHGTTVPRQAVASRLVPGRLEGRDE